MEGRVLVYSRRGRTRRVASDLAKGAGFGLSEIRCARYGGLFGFLRAHLDLWRGRCPEIEVVPPVGPADVLLVGGPVWRGGLALPVLRLLCEAGRLPPVAGVFVTRGRGGSGYRIEQQVMTLLNGAPDMPPILSIRAADLRETALPRAEGRMARFLATLEPWRERARLSLAVLPRKVNG